MARAGRELADRELTPAVAAAAFERVLAEVAQPS
jgi:hypothetical protein